jgi:hypothetical protein
MRAPFRPIVAGMLALFISDRVRNGVDTRIQYQETLSVTL